MVLSGLVVRRAVQLIVVARQLNFVLASRSLSPAGGVRALSEEEQWGSIGHRRLETKVA